MPATRVVSDTLAGKYRAENCSRWASEITGSLNPQSARARKGRQEITKETRIGSRSLRADLGDDNAPMIPINGSAIINMWEPAPPMEPSDACVHMLRSPALLHAHKSEPVRYTRMVDSNELVRSHCWKEATRPVRRRKNNNGTALPRI